MAELTSEYLDKRLESLATKLTDHFDRKIDEQTEALARMVNSGFEEVYRRLDVREQVEQHGRDIEEIKRVLKLA